MKKSSFLAAMFALMFCAAAHASGQQWGTLKGQFIFDGDAPQPVKVQVTKDTEFCGKHDLVAENVVVNPENNGIANIVLYLYQGRGAQKPSVHPDYAKTAAQEVPLDNVNCRFEPHVALLRTSQTLMIGNKDSVGHNTKVEPWAPGNNAINPIIPAGAVQPHKFPAAERRPIMASCSIHPWMTAWIVIADHPYMAVTDKDGKFEIKNVPAGKWTFQVWQEEVGYVQKVNVGGKATTWKKGRFTQDVKAGDNDLGVIKTVIKAKR